MAADGAVEPAASLAAAFRAARARTRALFALARPEAWHARPIALRHPIAFYEGHLDAFNWNTLFRRVLGEAPFAPALDALFERGIDPADEAAAARHVVAAWPPREAVAAYGREVERRLYAALDDPALYDRAPALARGHVLHMLLEHELMHQETLLYMVHQLPREARVARAEPAPSLAPPPPRRRVPVPAGVAVLGVDPRAVPFAWDNELERTEVPVASFVVDAYPVTNADFRAFVEVGGYDERAYWDPPGWAWRAANGVAYPAFWKWRDGAWWWRGLADEHPLPPAWPAFVTHAEARAYARFRGAALPTEAEWQRAAYGDGERAYPWGDAAPSRARGNFGFARWSPCAVDAHPEGATPGGVHDLLGNGWEWTDTAFAPLPGFRAHPAYPGYSADFFDGEHFVLKGGSHATDARLLRRSFRNWFRPTYPYVYATFRCVTR